MCELHQADSRMAAHFLHGGRLRETSRDRSVAVERGAGLGQSVPLSLSLSLSLSHRPALGWNVTVGISCWKWRVKALGPAGR